MSYVIPRPARVQIYGERCSGTNYVAELLRRNLRGPPVVDDFGWKHGWIRGDVESADDCVFVVVHRDPFDWLRSLHGMPWHAAPELRGVSFARFVRTPWRCVWGADMELEDGDPRRGSEMLHERDPRGGAPFANAMRLRTSKHRAWDELRVRARHHEFVRYEDVARDPRGFVRTFCERFALPRRAWFHDVTTFKGGRDRYRPKRYEPIDAEDLSWIVAELDHELELAHGYNIRARIPELTP